MKRLLRFALTAAIAWSATTVATPVARAEDDPAIEMARERFKEGVRFYDLKQYEKARAAFLQAYALKKHPAVLLNIAQSELRSGHEPEAAAHFAQFLRENPDAPATERAEAEKGLSAAKEAVAEVQLTVNEAGAEVLVDGETVGKAPLAGALYLRPGPHTIEARKGDHVARITHDAQAGQSANVPLTLAAPRPPQPKPQPAPADPSPEEEDVELSASTSDQSFFQWLGDSPLGMVGAGISVIGLGAGVGFSLAAKNKYDSANEAADLIREHVAAGNPPVPAGQAPCPNAQGYEKACAAYEDRVDSADQFKQFAIIGFAVGGAAAAGTIIYYFVDRGQPEQPRAATPRRLIAAPSFAQGFTGLSVSGNF